MTSHAVYKGGGYMTVKQKIAIAVAVIGSAILFIWWSLQGFAGWHVL